MIILLLRMFNVYCLFRQPKTVYQTSIFDLEKQHNLQLQFLLLQKFKERLKLCCIR